MKFFLENLSAQNASLEKQIKETESKILGTCFVFHSEYSFFFQLNFTETMNLLIESKALEVILSINFFFGFCVIFFRFFR